MAVVKNMMVRVGADFSSLTSQSKLSAVQTQNWANKTTSAFQKVASGSNVLSAAGTRVSRFTSLMSMAGKVIAAVAVARRVVQFGQDCISLASDLAEVQNVVDVVFPSMANRVNDFAKSAAASYGLSETMAKKYTGLYGAMAKSFGFTEAAAYDMSTTLTGLAGDVASFYNIGQDEAYTKLKSVFSGETETLKDLGVVMTQSALDAYALANGYGKTTSSMSEMEKVALRYAFVQSQLSAASGDFARTSGSWANQVRLLSLNFQQLKAIIGSGLIAVLTPFLRMLNTALSATVRFGNAVSSVFSSVFGTKKTAISGAVIEDVKDYSTGLDNVAASAGGASAAAKELKRDLMGFDEISKLSDNTSSSGSGGGGASGGGLSAGSGIGSSLISDAASNTEKFSGTLQKFHDWLSGLDLKPITTAWERLKESGGELASIIGGGLKWGLENVLAPLGKWTIEAGLPAAINSLATGFQTLSGALVALEKPAKWVWENGIKPFASRIGKGFTGTLTAASDSVSLFGDAFSDLRAMLKGEKSLSDLFDLGDTGGKLVVAGGLAQKVSESLSTLFGLRSSNGLVVPVRFKQEASEAVWKRFKAGWDKGKSRIVQIGNELHSKASELWQKFKTSWGDAKAKAVNIGNNLSSSASDLWQKFKSGWGAASARAVQIGNSLSTSAATLWQNFRSSWGSRAVSIGNSLSSSAATLWTNFRNGWGSRAVSIANSLSSSAATLWTNFRNGWGSRAVSIANSLSNSASALWQSFKNSWGSRGVSIVNSLTNTASKLWSDFKAGWSGKKLGISLTYDTNVSGVKRAVYKALGLSGWPTIRFAARGGIVSSATLLGNTMVGEAGTEAIIPLENHTEWLDRVADRLARQLSGGSSDGGQPLVVQVVLQGRVIGQTVVDYINGRTRTDGVLPIIL